LNGWPAGYRLIRHNRIDSTNSEARRLAEAGERGPVWITALSQTAGRGRRGRVWDSAVGNLAATLLVGPVPARCAQLSFAAALAVADTAAHFAPRAAVTVKWPNDVLADGRKLAGILLESGNGWLAVGIGINLTAYPEGTEFPATSLAALGAAPPSPDAALTLLAARFAHWYDLWMEQGFEPLRIAWLARAGGLGMPIRARLPRAEHRGVFAGLDADGALLLNQQGALRVISAGEVFF
jgi:BirA family biotin operon repressor/biotin-[acetyl-CoA-carboxylase] ligase